MTSSAPDTIRSRSQFLDWCKTVEEADNAKPKEIDFRSIAKGKPSENDWFPSFVETIRTSINNNEAALRIDFNIPLEHDQTLNLKGTSKNNFIDTLVLRSDTQRFIIEHAYIKQLIIHTEKPMDLQIRDCNILNISIAAPSSPKNHIHIAATNIGHLRLREKCVTSLEMESGSVLDIDCPVPGMSSPFSGSVVFSNVFFPKKLNDGFIRDAQPYRNMRHHLHALENGPMAELFHTLELRIDEVKDTSKSNKLFSLLYRGISVYGSSSFRPLWLMLASCVIATGVIYWCNGSVLAKDIHFYKGTETLLIQGGHPKFWQSAYLAFQPLINPLGILGNKAALIKPANIYIHVVIWLENLFVYICIVMFIFALRRRFKIPS